MNLEVVFAMAILYEIFHHDNLPKESQAHQSNLTRSPGGDFRQVYTADLVHTPKTGLKADGIFHRFYRHSLSPSGEFLAVIRLATSININWSIELFKDLAIKVAIRDLTINGSVVAACVHANVAIWSKPLWRDLLFIKLWSN